VSRHTVRNHLKSVFAKLGVSSQRELASIVNRRDADTNRFSSDREAEH
jgi:DNA-binding CsgD family transcriptional regulator